MCTKIASFLTLLLFVCAVPAWAVDHPVAVGPNGELMFSPMTLTINAGDTVTFTNNNNDIPHNVHSAATDSMQFECAHGCNGDGK